MAGSNCARMYRNANADAARAAATSVPAPRDSRAVQRARGVTTGVTLVTTMTAAPTTARAVDRRPMPTARMNAPVSAPARRQCIPSDAYDAKKIATGAARSALRCNGTPRTMRYAVRSVHRSSPSRPARSAAHMVTTPSVSDAAYTSVSVAFSQTDDMPPAATADANAMAPLAVARHTSRPVSPAATAVATAENRFVATAYGRKNQSFAQTFSTRMKSGVPGGCGMPSERVAAMNSPASQNVTSGASVSA